MPLITRNEIKELDEIHNETCISIFIPTHRGGEKVLGGTDVLKLKNQLKEVRNKLEKNKLGPRDVDKLLAPIEALLEDGDFWRHQSDGLAIFRSKDFFKKYTLPVYFEEFNYVQNDFYLKPLMPMFTGDGTFYVLGLEQQYVKLYEMTQHTITDVVIDDLVPSRLEDKVGYDREPNSLQFRSGADSQGRAFYHGHAESDHGHKDDIARFFRAIDKGLAPLLRNETAPMVVVAQEVMFPIYKQENTYKYLIDDYIDQKASQVDKVLLQEMAWEKVASIFDRERKDKLALYKEQQGTGRTSSGMVEVLQNAIDGRVDTLFVENRADILGTYDPDKKQVQIHDEETSSSISLLNKAAIKTFLNGGTVYLLEKEEMPNPNSRVNALYRY
ncbi:baeRF7 domain-containing protein [Arenibacter certesii]|uniref:Uncharacterized protein n=1 Tax=Arenibacter certesii TaxID=228955 RepID=A0A918J974_9FLAO|nr:hypothetical protein [Arenibacter certesii]GGW50785.1 hypothetical protein GCM10007383_38120 [Arenibacter certesii]